jgi:KaiC/GvpD/RAD55 family RecA-like ATPase
MHFVAAILRSPSIIANVAAQVHPHQLTQEPFRFLYGEMLALHVDGIEPTFMAVADRLRGSGRLDTFAVNGSIGFAALTDVYDHADRAGTAFGYVAGIKARAAERDRQRVALDIAAEAQKPTGSNLDLADLLDHWSQTLRGSATDAARWPAPVAVSQLATAVTDIDFLLDGCIARGHLTLLSALMKAGKSTFIGFLLRALQDGTDFIGRATKQCRALVVSEESEWLWIRRRDALGLTDSLSLMCRPMLVKPNFAEWADFVRFVADRAAALKCDLVVIDTTSAFAPWKSENDAAEVQGTLTPLNRLTQAGLAVLLVHHIGKADQSEGRAARGSTALAGAVDIILELRRYRADDADDRRRVLRGMGRFDEIPGEVVIELATDGSGYTAEGDRKAMQARELDDAIIDTLPDDAIKAIKVGEVHELLPADIRPQRSKLATYLLDGSSAGKWGLDGTGKPNNPRKYFRI